MGGNGRSGSWQALCRTRVCCKTTSVRAGLLLPTRERYLGKEGSGTARGVARKPLVLVRLADVVVQVPLVQVEAAAALVRTAERLPVALVRLLVRLHARLGVEDPVAPLAGKACVHLTVTSSRPKDKCSSSPAIFCFMIHFSMRLGSARQIRIVSRSIQQMVLGKQ